MSLLEANANHIFPIVLPSLTEASNKHWNKSVQTMSTNVLKNFMSTNQKAFDYVIKTTKQTKKIRESKKVEAMKRWSDLDLRAKKSNAYKEYVRRSATKLIP